MALVDGGWSFPPFDASVAACEIDSPINAYGIEFPPGTSLSFSPSGRVKKASFEAPRTLRDVCVHRDVEFHPNGSLRKLPLPTACTIQDNALPGGAVVQFRPSGALLSARFIEHMGHMPHGEPREGTRVMTFDERGVVTSSAIVDVRIWDRPRPPAAR